MAERPELPVLTIHDSILTVPGEVEYVRAVILDEFAKLDIEPALKEECYESRPVARSFRQDKRQNSAFTLSAGVMRPLMSGPKLRVLNCPIRSHPRHSQCRRIASLSR